MVFPGVLGALFRVRGARDADTARRSSLLMVVAAIVGFQVIATALSTSIGHGSLQIWLITVPLGASAMVATFLLARRGHADAAALLLSGYVTAMVGLVAWVDGPSGNRMGVAISGVVAVGAVLSPRLTVAFGMTLVAIVLAMVAGQATGLYQPAHTGLRIEPLYAPFVRQGITCALIVLALRKSYDRLYAQVRERERERTDAVTAARSINQSLEAMVGERTAALSATHERLSQLAATLANDLGAGLGAIRARIDEFTAAEAALGPEALRDVAKARAAAERLSVMTERLHEHASVGTAALRPTRVDMDQLIRAVIDDLGPSARAADIDWQVAPLPPAFADATLLRTVVENLIENAVKFSRHRAPPRIAIGFDAAQGRYFVRDNGVGFDPRQARSLFKPFRRLHAGTEFEGHGVGLANARRIIRRLGGDLVADGVPDRGATFAFRLPPAGSEPP